MKKALAITAVAVALFTTIFFGYSMLNDKSSDPGDMQGFISFTEMFLLSGFF